MMIEILDSTLRDGMQGEGVNFSKSDKFKIFTALDQFGVDYIEAGNPFASHKDLEFFKEIVTRKHGSKAVAFGSTVRKGMTVEEDECMAALLKAETKCVSVFGKAWDLHVDCILNVSLEENLKMIESTIAYLKSKGRKVIFDAEHFFDGFKANEKYALEVIKTAEKAGADTICLCDTNGGAFPDEITTAVKAAKKILSVRIGIHCHNDNGCAVASTMAAHKAGATHIQGTFVGIGERCGNTNLSTVIGNLQLKKKKKIVSTAQMQTLTDTARYIAEVANIKLAATTPYVGSGAFSHKGGMHADGVEKNPVTFEHISPDVVGNERKYLLSEVSGRAAVLSAIRRFDSTLDKNSPETLAITAKVKELEEKGFQFEAAAASFDMLVMKELGQFNPHFHIDYFKIISSRDRYGKTEKATALVKIKVGENYEITADEGYGPVNAIDKALRKALIVFYPEVENMRMSDYKVRVIGAGISTAAVTRVLIECTDGDDVWTTVGASKDIISASVTAFIDSLEYLLYKNDKKGRKNKKK